MNKELLEELIEAVRNNRVYDFIANNYWELTNEELKDIALEIIYMYQDALRGAEPDAVEKEDAIANIKERLCIE